MLLCKDVTRLAASEALQSAPLGRRLGVRLHLIMCRHCRRYVGQLAAIGAGARQLWRPVPDQDRTIRELERRILAGMAQARDE